MARRSAIEIADVQDVEEESKPAERHVAAIQGALEDAGIAFIDAVGVELRPVEIDLKGAAGGTKGKRP